MKKRAKCNRPFFSIIIPIYNAAPFLERCLNSLLCQTFMEIEIILVNDGSTDKSLSICQSYASQDGRVIVYEQENMGRVAARKAGIGLAEGQYISFIDADDWVEEDMYEQIYEQMHEPKNIADIVAFGLVEEYGSRRVIRKENLDIGFYEADVLEILKGQLLCNGIFFEFGILPHLCDKVFKKDFLVASGFMEIDNDLVYGEDAVATFRACINSVTLQVLAITPYHYRQNNYVNGFQTLQVGKKFFPKLYQEFQRSIVNCQHKEMYEWQIKYYFWFVLLLRQFENLQSNEELFPYTQNVLGKKVILYGAGGLGVEVYKYIEKTSCCKIVCWVDREYAELDKRELPLDSPQKVYVESYDYILITILNERIAKSIKDELKRNGVAQEKILHIEGKHLKRERLPEWLTDYDEEN